MIFTKSNSFIATIEDDFDLEKIISCGQCFRAKRLLDGSFRFITGNKVLYITKVEEKSYAVSCDEETWCETWFPYFSLGTNYQSIRSKVRGLHPFIDQAIKEGRGLRILHQEPWEMLITFITSQRKSIPAIASCIEKITERYGTDITTPFEHIMSFPTPGQMRTATLHDLQGCALGYRASYVMDAIDCVLSGELQLDEIKNMSNDQLMENFLQVKGVGPKVANCIGLFAYGRLGMVPIDVWINRAINEHFIGCNPFPEYGEYAGVIQQYVFYYEKSHQSR